MSDLGSREYRSLSDIRSLVAGRLDRASQPHMFDRFGWLSALHEHCMADNGVRIMRAWQGGCEAWLCLADSGRQKQSALANWYSFAFRPIFVGDPDPATRLALLERIARDLGRRAAQVDLYPVLADDGLSDLLLTAFRRAGWFAVARQMGTNHFLDLGGRDFDSYWAGRPGPLRTLVRRKAKSAPFTFDVHTQFSDAAWQDYVTVYRRSWKPDEPGYAFLRAIAMQEGAAGTLRVGLARIEGRPVAAQLWTVENGVALIHKLAHDSAADALSPGTLLSHHLFRYVMETDRVATIDYGTGDNPYKTEWMDAARRLNSLDCFNPRFPRAWFPAARTAISKLVG